ncbi:MAG: hypothetical protein H7X85_10430, partial [Thermoanaerobaculia bacterium]|nr:hypothetical protein [Thermoanaerobaculia bacterium]
MKARLEHTFTGHTAPLRKVAFSPDGRRLATSSVDRTVKIWSIPDGKLTRTLAHPAGVTAIAFFRDGGALVAGSYDRDLRIWRLPGGTLERTLPGHGGTVWSVAVSPDGQR